MTRVAKRVLGAGEGIVLIRKRLEFYILAISRWGEVKNREKGRENYRTRFWPSGGCWGVEMTVGEQEVSLL
jgi:hypothetical protein